MAKSSTAQTESQAAQNPLNKVLEFPKVFQDMKMPNVDFTGFMNQQQKNIEAWSSAGQAAMAGWQKAMHRQTEMANAAAHENSEMFSQMFASGSPEEKMASQADLAKQVFDRAVTSTREMVDTVSRAQFEAFEIISTRMGEQLEDMRSLIKCQKSKKS